MVSVIAAFTTEAVQLNCDFRYYTVPLIGSLYTCQATVIWSQSATLEIVTGNHQGGRTHDNVEYIYIPNQNMPVIPQGIGAVFKNIRSLRFDNNNMLSISAADMQQFPKVEIFYVYDNKLTSIDGDMFLFTPLLRQFGLSDNQVQHIGHNLVTNLNSLQTFFVERNICINRSARNRADVLALGPQLSVICPPLVTSTVSTTTATTTTMPSTTTTIPPTTNPATTTTTELPIVQCSCLDEIDELRAENQRQNYEIDQQNVKIQEQNFIIEQLQKSNENLQLSNDQLTQANEKLFELNTAVEDRLLEVEMKLRELLSLPSSN